jgi:Fe-Mn family superoxide dismutase
LEIIMSATPSARPDSSLETSSGLDRRNFLKAAGITVAAAGTIGSSMLPLGASTAVAQTPAAPPPPTGPYKLPPLGYAFDALEPYIDAETMQIHHDKHHQAYVNNLNVAVAGTALGNQPVEQLIANLDQVPEDIRTAVQNNGGGHANHSLFWQLLKKDGGQPGADLARAIDAQLGGYEKFKADFSKAGITRFGSGWAWLLVDENKKLVIESSANQDAPIMVGKSPVLGLDVWEHAYYLKYQNRRPEYVEAFFSVINWPKVDELYAKSMAS